MIKVVTFLYYIAFILIHNATKQIEIMKTFKLKTFDKKDAGIVSYKNWDEVISIVEQVNENQRKFFNEGIIDKNLLSKSIIGFIVGDKQTYCL